MRVRANYPHFSTDGALHEAGSEYELTGDELAFRLKDQIVSDASALATDRPAVVDIEAHTAAVDAMVAATPLTDPEE